MEGTPKKKEKKKKQQTPLRGPFQLYSHRDDFSSQGQRVNSCSCVIPVQGQVKVAETGGATIMRERLLPSSRFWLGLRRAVYFCHLRHSRPGLFYYPVINFITPIAEVALFWTALCGGLTVRAYCADSMVKFKLGRRIRKKRGRILRYLLRGALPLFDLPLENHSRAHF